MSKTNLELVEYCKAQVGRPYWFGTFGLIANEALWKSKSNQYPAYYTDKRRQKAMSSHLGKKVHDCIGLYKGFLWSDSFDAPAEYNSKQDYSANSLWNSVPSTKKGTMSTMPEVFGLGLWRNNHFGVYIGNGLLVEAKGFDYGVVTSKLSESNFSGWCYLPHIEYVEDKKGEPVKPTVQPTPEEPKTQEFTTYTVKSGDTLNRIAKSFGVSVDSIVKLNDIANPNLIYPKQVLKIKANEVIEDKPTEEYDTYTVKKGDTLYGIADRMLNDSKRYPEIMKLNGLTGSLIKPGQVLKLPKKK